MSLAGIRGPVTELNEEGGRWEGTCGSEIPSVVSDSATLWTVSRQAPLSVGFSRQEYRCGLPCPPPRDLPNPGLKPRSLMSPALAGRFFITGTTWETKGEGRREKFLAPHLAASLGVVGTICCHGDFPGGSVVKKLPSSVRDAGDSGSVPGLGRSPGGGNGNPFQYSCLGTPVDRGAWRLQSLCVHCA